MLVLEGKTQSGFHDLFDYLVVISQKFAKVLKYIIKKFALSLLILKVNFILIQVLPSIYAAYFKRLRYLFN